MKIIIDYSGDLEDAIRRVLQVVSHGRVSRSYRGGSAVDHFSWATTWKDGTAVYVRRKDHAGAADSFNVIAPPPQTEQGEKNVIFEPLHESRETMPFSPLGGRLAW